MSADAPQDGEAGSNLARERANRTPMQVLLDLHLVAWEPDRAVFAYTVRPENLNRSGRLHGGILASLLDSASGYCGCFTPVPGERVDAVTLSLTVNFVSSVREGRLLAEARRTGGGRTVFFADAWVRDEAGRLVASSTGTFKYIAPHQG